MLVYKQICAVSKDIGEHGLKKNQKNQAQGFMYRGIDDLYNLINPILAKHELCILPVVKNKEYSVLPTRNGSTNRCVLTVEFDIVASDGSKHTVATVGEANDSGDKSTNKAMSIAYKYMALMVFAIPIVGNDDADAHIVEAPVKAPIKITPKKDAVFDFDAWCAAIDSFKTVEALRVHYSANVAKMTPEQIVTADSLCKKYKERKQKTIEVQDNG